MVPIRLLFLLPSVFSLNVIIYNVLFSHSHTRQINLLADVLAKDGHNVTMMMSNAMEYGTIQKPDNVEIVWIEQSPAMEKLITPDALDNFNKQLWTTDATPGAGFEIFANLTLLLSYQCEAAILNPAVNALRQRHFDVGISEAFDFCGFGLLEMIGVKTWVSCTTSITLDHQAYLLGVPRAPSYVPAALGNTNEKMTITQRAANAVSSIVGQYLFLQIADNQTIIFQRLVGPNFPTMRELVSRSALHITNSIPLLNFPQPTLHKVIDVGGIGQSKPKTLSKEWADIVKSKPTTVLISFGSIVKSSHMDPKQKEAILDMARTMKDTQFIWKYEEDDLTNVPSNMYVSKWTPQADLLASGHINLFITHGGLGSVTELAFSAIPAIVIPVMMSDQPRNAEMLKRHGTAESFSKFDLAKKDKLMELVSKMINDPSYKARAEELASMLNHVPFKPQEVLLRNVEFVGRFGSLPQLAPYGRELSFVQYFLLDIVFIALFVVVFVLLLAMSLSWGAQYPKLKANLRLSINRMKMMGKKKTELAMKARTEIADYILGHKADRARIRVEHIIREDYLVEAYELLEMYCDLLLARFGLIEQMKTLDDGIAEAVISILWAAPRITTDIPEFKVISDQLTHKYGKPFAEAARGNQLEAPAKVSPKLIAKLDISAPPKPLVERYMIEIASAAGIDFNPDPDVMREDEVNQAEKMLIEFHKKGGGGNGGGGGGGQVVSQPTPQNQDGAYGWNFGSGAPAPGGPPPPPPYNGGNIYEVPSTSPQYDVPPGNDYNWPAPSQQGAPGVIQLPQIGANGLPINPPSGPPHAPPPSAYPFLSQRGSTVNPMPPGNAFNNPSAPPQTVHKPEGPPPSDFGEMSSPAVFGVVKWREGEDEGTQSDAFARDDEHIYAEVPVDHEYQSLAELKSTSQPHITDSIDIEPALPSNVKATQTDDPLPAPRFTTPRPEQLIGLPPPGAGERYVIGPNGVPILVRQNAFDATTPSEYQNDPSYQPGGRYPWIDSGQKTLENFSEGDAGLGDLSFPEVPTGGLPSHKNNGGSGGGAGGGGNDLDFDDLARRFDQLKKK
ncbi:unnamed protein product, partial [Mesorhabditis spiculigera]